MKDVAVSVILPPGTLAFRVSSPEEIATGPIPDIPELRELNRYTGIWDEEVSDRPEIERQEIGEWVLGGRFLRQSWSSEAGDGGPKASGMTMLTYDPAHGRYRSWAFFADGTMIENEGVWDAATLTMRWQHLVEETGEIVQATTTFTSDSTTSWSIVKSDAGGKVLREISGTSMQRVPSGTVPAS